jgi:FMN phosphatase YigB (HAD superfamily)
MTPLNGVLYTKTVCQPSAPTGVDLHNTELIAWWNALLVKLVDSVEGVVDELIGRMPVYALTNTNPTHYEYFTRHIPLLQRLDRVIASFHMGIANPRARYSDRRPTRGHPQPTC